MTNYESYVNAVLSEVAEFEAEEAAFEDCLPMGDGNWMHPWRYAIDKHTIIDMWDDDDEGLVTLADAFVAYCNKHGLHKHDRYINDYVNRRNPSSADHLFWEIGFC